MKGIIQTLLIGEDDSSDLEYLLKKPCLRSACASLHIPAKASRVCARPKGAHPAGFFFCVGPEGLQKEDLKELKWELNSREDRER